MISNRGAYAFCPGCGDSSATGDEGPGEVLGRPPVRWCCDGCGRKLYAGRIVDTARVLAATAMSVTDQAGFELRIADEMAECFSDLFAQERERRKNEEARRE